jgi:hypothetical protein
MKRYTLAALLAGAMALGGCGGGGSSVTPSGSSNATLSAALMDGPFRTSGGTVTAVNIAVSKVEAVGSGGVQTIATFSPAQQINLLNYQTSALQLGSAQIPAGTYQQIRFVLDTSQANNTSVTVNGTTYPLSIPSAAAPGGFGNATSTDNGDGAGTSGVKVNVSLNAQAGQSDGFLIDFNAAESIVETGNGNWMMKPVLVATAQALAGSISGTVKNNAGTAVANAQVVAQQNGTTVNSGVTDANGNFQINALPAGSYTLVVNNTWTNQAGQSEAATGADGTAAVTDSTPVTVTGGQTTSVSLTD